jgi:hypothetical protein
MQNICQLLMGQDTSNASNNPSVLPMVPGNYRLASVGVGLICVPKVMAWKSRGGQTTRPRSTPPAVGRMRAALVHRFHIALRGVSRARLSIRSVARFPGALGRQGSCGGRFTFQDPLKADGDNCAHQGTRDIDPSGYQVAANQVGSE